MDDFVYYNELYDIYGGLLTDKQKKYFEDYFFQNLSYSEMSEAYNISRNAAFKQIHIVMDRLQEYENTLGLKKKREQIMDLVSNTDEDFKKKIEDILY